MTFPISYNIDAEDLRPWLTQNDYAGLKAHLQAVRPAVVLVMNGLWLAVRIKNEWLPDCIVIHRDYSPHEGSEWMARPPHEWVNRWRMQGHPEIVRYLTNEPGVSEATAVTFAGREAETMRLARAADFTVVCANFSVGTPERQLIQDGRLDELLKAAVEGNHYLGCHEYMTVCLPASLIGDDKLGDKLAMQPSNWPLEPIRGDYSDYWYLFRSSWLVARSRGIGIADPKFILTEFGYDDIRNAGNGDVITDLRERYGMTIYNNDMRGVNTYEKIWNDYYPGVDHNEVIRQQFEWWLAVKPSWIIGACLFGINSDWDVPHGHDWSADVRRGFSPVLEEMSRAMVEVPDTKPEVIATPYTGDDWRRGKVRTSVPGSFTNIRKLPHVQSDDMGDIREEQAFDIAFKNDSLWSAPGGNYTWVALRRVGVAYTGESVVYAARSLVVIEVDVPDEPPPPDVPDEPPLPFDEVAVEAIVNRVIDKRMLNLTDHIETGHIPRPFAKTISRTMRVLADMLDAAIALEEAQEQSQPTLAQIANDVYSKADNVEMAGMVDKITDNSATEPPKN